MPSDETTPPVTNTYRAMEGHSNTLKKKLKVNYQSDFGISGSEESCFSSIFSNTDEELGSGADIIVKEMLVIIKSVANIAVVLVKKLLADLEDIKLS